MICSEFYSSPVGRIALASDGNDLTGLWLEGQKYFLGTISGTPVLQDDLPVFRLAREWLDRYFAGEAPNPDCLPLAPIGGAFRQTVWSILRTIPYGSVMTYGDIARETAARMGRESMSSQAVGGAVAHNPLSILIPCHRVVGTSGSLTGYAGGIDKKIWLLSHEGVDVSRFSRPDL